MAPHVIPHGSHRSESVVDLLNSNYNQTQSRSDAFDIKMEPSEMIQLDVAFVWEVSRRDAVYHAIWDLRGRERWKPFLSTATSLNPIIITMKSNGSCKNKKITSACLRLFFPALRWIKMDFLKFLSGNLVLSQIFFDFTASQQWHGKTWRWLWVN